MRGKVRYIQIYIGYNFNSITLNSTIKSINGFLTQNVFLAGEELCLQIYYGSSEATAEGSFYPLSIQVRILPLKIYLQICLPDTLGLHY